MEVKKIVLICIAVILALVLLECATTKADDRVSQDYSSNYSHSSDNTFSSGSGKQETYDWMKEQAEGKDYSTDDGGEYYCMGKGDTCSNKTKNAYDLYCTRCDPDNDNREG